MKLDVAALQLLLSLLIQIVGVVSIYWKLRTDIALIQQRIGQFTTDIESIRKQVTDTTTDLRLQAQRDIGNVVLKTEELSKQVQDLSVHMARLEGRDK